MPPNSLKKSFKKAVMNGDVDEVLRIGRQHPELLNDTYRIRIENSIERVSIISLAAQQFRPNVMQALAKLGASFAFHISHTSSPVDILLTQIEYSPPKDAETCALAQKTLRMLFEYAPPDKAEAECNYMLSCFINSESLEKLSWLPRILFDQCVTRQKDHYVFDLHNAFLAQIESLAETHYATLSPKHAQHIAIFLRSGFDISHYTAQPLSTCELWQKLLRKKYDERSFPHITHHAQRLLNALHEEATDWLTNWIKRGAPLSMLETEGRTTDAAQQALSTLGAQEFFSSARWQGHEREALAALQTLERIAQPYWKTQIAQVDRTTFLRDWRRPAEETSIAMLSSTIPLPPTRH